MVRSCCALMVIAVAGRALAQAPEIPVHKLTVSPAAAPVPALRYTLLPDLRDTTPGNAAMLYYRAFSPDWHGIRANKELQQTINDALDKSPAEVKALSDLHFIRDWNMLKEVDRAARRTYCDWELTPRIREEGIWLLLPDVQALREFARYLKIRAKLELADGQFDKAAYTFQTSLQLGRHAAHGPTLIQALVGAAVAAITFNQIEEWVQVPGAPNLYWALTDLPQPFIDLRMPLQGERLWMENLLPGFREALADPTKVPPELAPDLRRKLTEAIEGARGPSLYLAAMAMKNYSAAKAYLREHGRTVAQVEALPVLSAVMLYEFAEYDRLSEEIFKVEGLPYWVARPYLERADRALRQEVIPSHGQGLSLVGLLMPAILKVHQSQAQRDRTINLLGTIEALRLYAAAHGQWPEKLADITDVPVPIDPFTGQPFDYRLDGDKAILTAPPPAGEQPYAGNSSRYEISLRK
jgi:hypothetical protein